MTSLRIAELIEVPHNNVKRTIRTLGTSGIISLGQIEGVKVKRKQALINEVIAIES